MRRDALSPYSLDALKAMPRPLLFTKETDELVARYKAWFEQRSGRTLYPMQVEMLLIETLSFAMAMLGAEAQMVVEQHLVAFAQEAHLDLLGGNRSTPRLPASFARCFLRFTPKMAFATDKIIPANTRVATQAGDIVFLTVKQVLLPANGEVIVEATAETAGSAANGFAPESLTTLLDILPNIAVTNTTQSEGGAEVEQDDPYRLRLANAFERISKAGPREAYREEVMRVSPAILDCAVVRPKPCYIDLYVLTNTGNAGDALKAQVRQALDEETARPLGDEVTLKDCAPFTLSPTLLIRVRGGASVIEPLAYAKARAVIAEWEGRLGAELAPSDLIDAVKLVAGVIDCEVSNFTYMHLAPSFYAKLGTLTLNMVVLP
jgi:phage-related baseplate assembly protein